MFTLILVLMICVGTATACEAIRWYLQRMLPDTRVRSGGIAAEAELRVG